MKYHKTKERLTFLVLDCFFFFFFLFSFKIWQLFCFERSKSLIGLRLIMC